MKISALSSRVLPRRAWLPMALLLLLGAVFVFFVTYLSGVYFLRNIARAAAAFAFLSAALLVLCSFRQHAALRVALYIFTGGLVFSVALMFCYYYQIGLHVSQSDVKAILQSDTEESLEYFSTKIFYVKNALFALFLALATCGALRLLGNALPRKTARRGARVSVAALACFAAFCFFFSNTHLARTLRYTVVEYYSFLHAFNRLSESAPQTPLSRPAENTLLVVVVGESANRDFMESYGGPIAGNTPWLSQKKAEPSFVIFSNAYASIPATAQAVVSSFTDGRELTGLTYPKGSNLFDISRRAGLYTAWLSNQVPLGKNDTPVSALAYRADFTLFVQDSELYKNSPFLDEILLEPLQDQLALPQVKNGPALVVLHLAGSHASYRKRYPAGTAVPDFSASDLAAGLDEKGAGNLGPYSASLQYTDSVLERLQTTLQQSCADRPVVLLYFSDHGEDLGFKGGDHDPKYFTWPMVRIPFFIWMSPAYQERHPQELERLKAHKDAAFTNDLVYDLLLGLLGIEHESYDGRYDISSARYSLTPDSAAIYNGKTIAEDPQFGLK